MPGQTPWTDTRLRAAWARGDWGAVLREYRRAAGLSQRQLEPLIDMPQPHISAIESGRRRVVSRKIQARITEGLNVPTELTEAAHAGWAPPAELRERVAHAYATGRADQRTADYLRDVLAKHRRAEDEGSGVPLWHVVRSQLDAVTRLLPDSAGPAADELLLLAAEHAHWLSWVAWTEERRGEALAWLDSAHGWAVDGGHGDMASWVMRVRSHFFLSAGDPVRALRTAEAARRGSGLSPAAASAATHEAAMAAAAVGERDRARRLSDEALRLARQAPDEGERPGWLYFLDETRARLQHATAAYACRDWNRAADELRDALPALEGYPRDHAYYSARLADAERRA
ncbi:MULTISPECIES: helix-turn-helix domain-containing protein [unclassified Streptomyces]|uniref:helix-turn-helix domain-containing protein n=1 Tax=unclassified Streptomyces TaxID=2593676 RepID=UPI0036E6B163